MEMCARWIELQPCHWIAADEDGRVMARVQASPFDTWLANIYGLGPQTGAGEFLTEAAAKRQCEKAFTHHTWGGASTLAR